MDTQIPALVGFSSVAVSGREGGFFLPQFSPSKELITNVVDGILQALLLFRCW